MTLLRNGVYRVVDVEAKEYTLPQLPPATYTVIALDQAGDKATIRVVVGETGYSIKDYVPLAHQSWLEGGSTSHTSRTRTKQASH